MRKPWLPGMGHRSRKKRMIMAGIGAHHRPRTYGGLTLDLTRDFGVNNLVADSDVDGIGPTGGPATDDTTAWQNIMATVAPNTTLVMPEGRYSRVTKMIPVYKDGLVFTTPGARGSAGIINDSSTNSNQRWEHPVFGFAACTGSNWRAQNAWFLITGLDGSAYVRAGDNGFITTDGGVAALAIGRRLHMCSARHTYTSANAQTNPERIWTTDVVAFGPGNRVYVDPPIPFELTVDLLAGADPTTGGYGLYSATTPGAEVTGNAMAPATGIPLNASMKTGIGSVLNNEWHSADVEVRGWLMRAKVGQVGAHFSRGGGFYNCLIRSGKTGVYGNRAQSWTMEGCEVRTGNNLLEFGICSNYSVVRDVDWYWSGDPSYGEGSPDPWMMGEGEFSHNNLYEDIRIRASGWDPPTTLIGLAYMIRAQGGDSTYRNIHMRTPHGHGQRMIFSFGPSVASQAGNRNVLTNLSFYCNATTPVSADARPIYIAGNQNVVRGVLYVMPTNATWSAVGKQSILQVSANDNIIEAMLVGDANGTRGGWLIQPGCSANQFIDCSFTPSDISNNGTNTVVSNCAPTNNLWANFVTPPWSIPGFYAT